MDPSTDLSTKVALVERNFEPRGIPLNDPEAVAKTSKQDLVALAQEIEKADSFVKANTYSKLQVIVEQVGYLKKQAERILKEADRNIKLHHVACNFVKRPGHVYHLYKRETGQLYFSMISPEEWGDSGPGHAYEGSYRLEHDQSWTPIEGTEKKNNEMSMLMKLCSNIPMASLKDCGY